MTFDTVKERLHDYIEHADQDKVVAIYTLLNNEMSTVHVYDEATLNLLEATRDNMITGKEKTYSLEQTIANVQLTDFWNERIQPLIAEIQNSRNSDNYRYVQIANIAHHLYVDIMTNTD